MSNVFKGKIFGFAVGVLNNLKSLFCNLRKTNGDFIFFGIQSKAGLAGYQCFNHVGIYRFPTKQLIKIIEEVGELASAILKKKRKEEIDAVGDIMVTLIIFAEIRGYDVMSALGYAYQEIKDRTGKMVDGSFIKD